MNFFLNLSHDGVGPCFLYERLRLFLFKPFKNCGPFMPCLADTLSYRPKPVVSHGKHKGIN